MKYIRVMFLAAVPSLAQSALPDAPRPRTPQDSIAMNVALASKYSWSRSQWDMTVSGSLRYRLPDSNFSVGLLYSHTALSGENLSFLDLNYRFYEHAFKR